MDARAHTIDFYFIFNPRRYPPPCIVWRARWIYKMDELGVSLVLDETKGEKVLVEAHVVWRWLMLLSPT